MSAYTGTAPLTQLNARRDRLRLSVWIYVIVLLIASTAASFGKLYHTVAARMAFGASIKASGALVALDGRVFDDTTTGGLTAWRFGGVAAVLAALMAVLTVVRHTRAEEDAGRTELVGAAVVGRRAPLTAALLLAVVASFAIGVLTAIAMALLGYGSTGGIALGAAVAGGGIMFAGVAAVAAQVANSSRGANGLALAALGLAFVLRAAGDAGHTGSIGFLSWLSPIGWTQQVRPYAHERWWVFALILGFAAVTIRVAYALVGHRDLGAGLLADRLGPPRAPAGLRGALSLAVRLQRGAWAGWAAGLFFIGLALGGAGKSVGDLVKTSRQLGDIVRRMGGEQSMVNAYYSATISLFALAVTVYGIAAANRARTEETDQRAEPVLATTTTRTAYLASHTLVAFAGSALLLVMLGLGGGISYAATTGDVGKLPLLVGASLGQWPAVVIFVGLAVFLVGAAPRAIGLAWAALGAAAILGQVGVLLRLPRSAMDLSPFTHSPKLPGGPVPPLPLVTLGVIALALTAAGLVGFRRRDIG